MVPSFSTKAMTNVRERKLVSSSNHMSNRVSMCSARWCVEMQEIQSRRRTIWPKVYMVSTMVSTVPMATNRRPWPNSKSQSKTSSSETSPMQKSGVRRFLKWTVSWFGAHSATSAQPKSSSSSKTWEQELESHVSSWFVNPILVLLKVIFSELKTINALGGQPLITNCYFLKWVWKSKLLKIFHHKPVDPTTIRNATIPLLQPTWGITLLTSWTVETKEPGY